MQRTAALQRIEMMRFNVRPNYLRAPLLVSGRANGARIRINHLTVRARMCDFAKADSRGAEAAQRPQLSQVSNLHKVRTRPRVFRSSPASVTSRSSFSSSRRVRCLNQCSPWHGRSWREEGRRI
jgi:hypothetical protein